MRYLPCSILDSRLQRPCVGVSPLPSLGKGLHSFESSYHSDCSHKVSYSLSSLLFRGQHPKLTSIFTVKTEATKRDTGCSKPRGFPSPCPGCIQSQAHLPTQGSTVPLPVQCNPTISPQGSLASTHPQLPREFYHLIAAAASYASTCVAQIFLEAQIFRTNRLLSLSLETPVGTSLWSGLQGSWLLDPNIQASHSFTLHCGPSPGGLVDTDCQASWDF